MIKILIVEDNPHKLRTVVNLLKDDLLIASEYIDSASDIKSAKKYLKVGYYDLLILDLVLPIEEGDDASPEKGVRFLSDISSNDRLNSPIHIIGLTERDDLTKKFDESFHSNLWHLINYKADEINWQDKLKNVTNHLISTRNSFYEKHSQNQKYDIAFITALNTPEFDYVLRLSENWKPVIVENDATKYYTTEFTKGDKSLTVVAACADQMGMTASSNLSTKICIHFKPKYIFMTGICAGLKDRELNFGDILIAEQVWDYGSGKMKDIKSETVIEDIKFEPDPRPIQLSPELKSKVNNFLRKDAVRYKIQENWKSAKPASVLKAVLGPVASGSYVISSESRLKEIREHQRKLLGVEMEGYGVYYAAEYTSNQYSKAIMIKSVSDHGDSSKNDGYQEYAAYTSTQFAYHFVMEEFF